MGWSGPATILVRATRPKEPATADDKQLIVGIDIGKNSFPVVGRTERVAGTTSSFNAFTCHSTV